MLQNNEIPEYFDDNMTKQLLYEVKTAEAKRKMKAFIISRNCVARYRGLLENQDRVFKALEQDKLYFSTALGYNDPYDTLMYVNYDELVDFIRYCWEKNMPQYIYGLKEHNVLGGLLAESFVSDMNPNKSKWENEFLKEVKIIVDKLKKMLHDNIKGICFSEDFTSILMWSHYASNHKGIALLYDKEDLIQSKSYNRMGEELDDKFILEKIVYGKERIDATKYINDYILKRQKMCPRFAYDSSMLPEPSKRTLKNIILTKNEVWKYEQEIRLLPRKLDFELESNMQYLSIRPKALILGAHINDLYKEKIIKIAKRKKIIIYEAWLNEEQKDYNVVFQEYGC